jgi:hypothetical protein
MASFLVTCKDPSDIPHIKEFTACTRFIAYARGRLFANERNWRLTRVERKSDLSKRSPIDVLGGVRDSGDGRGREEA